MTRSGRVLPRKEEYVNFLQHGYFKKQTAEGFLGRVDAGHSALMGSRGRGWSCRRRREGWAGGVSVPGGLVRGLGPGPSFKPGTWRRDRRCISCVASPVWNWSSLEVCNLTPHHHSRRRTGPYLKKKKNVIPKRRTWIRLVWGWVWTGVLCPPTPASSGMLELSLCVSQEAAAP